MDYENPAMREIPANGAGVPGFRELWIVSDSVAALFLCTYTGRASAVGDVSYR